MTIQQLDEFFTEYGYSKISSNLPDYCCYFRIEGQCATACNTMRSGDRFYLSSDEYDMLRSRIRQLFKDKGIDEVHILTLVIAESWENTQKLCRDDPFCWMISSAENRLFVSESQTPDFYGIRAHLEEFLLSIRNGDHKDETAGANWNGRGTDKVYGSAADGTSENGAAHKSVISWWRSLSMKEKKSLPWVSTVIVVVNVVIFILCCIYGEPLYKGGSLSVADIIGDGSYYRLISSMFLHADLNHLVSNMLILFYIGEEVEKKTGHIRFTILYFISGIIGDIFSMGFELYSGERYSSVGASGAIFGVIGSLLFIVIVCGGRTDDITLGRITFIIVFSLYSGFTSQGVNNAAHVGGLLGGLAVSFLMWISSSRFRDRIRVNGSKGAGNES